MKVNKYAVQLAALAVFGGLVWYVLHGLAIEPGDAVQIIKASGLFLLAAFGVAANSQTVPDNTPPDGDAP